MSVATGIEIVAGGQPEPNLGLAPVRTPGGAMGAGGGGAAAASSTLSSQAGAENFRSGWQSLLASLGAGMDGLSGIEDGADGISSAAPLPGAESAPKAAPAAATLAGRAAPSAGKTRGPGEGVATLSPGASRAGVSVWRPFAAGSRPAPGNAAAAATASGHIGESANAHPFNSLKSAKPEGASAGTAPEPAAQAAGNHSLTMPAPGTAIPAADPAQAPPPSTLAGLTSDFNSLRDRSSTFSPPDIASGLATADGDQAADGTTARSRVGVALESAGSALHGSELPAVKATAGNSAASGSMHPDLSPADGEISSAGASPGSSAAALHSESSRGAKNLSPGQAPSAAEASSLDETEAVKAAGLPSASIPMRIPLESATQGKGANRSQTPNPGPEPEGVASLAAGNGLDRSAAADASGAQTNRRSMGAAIAQKPGVTGGARPPMQGAHRSSMAVSAEIGNPLMRGQPSFAAQDASAFALSRDQAGRSGAIATGGEGSAGSAASSGGSASRETFAALDAETVSGTPAWIHTGGKRIEAGFQDPALGWVGVRADSSGGGVHATLIPGSADAAQALGGHLGGLNAYLAEHHMPVETLTVAAAEGGWTEAGTGQGASQGTHTGAGQDMGQGAQADRQPSAAPGAPSLLSAAGARIPARAEVPDMAVQAARPGGVHISVMA